MPKILLVLFFFMLLFIAIFAGFLFWEKSKIETVGTVETPIAPDQKNLTYIIEGQSVKLTDGYAQIESAPGSTSYVVTKYFGNEATGDLNGDGMADIAFLLTQETGGTGAFYYIAAALKMNVGYKALNTIFLGDRIAPQTTQINNGELLVNYAIRKPNEPFTAIPSVGVSKYFKIENGILVEQIDKAEFATPVDFMVNQQVKFEDGLIVTLEKIDDSRCKPNVVCIWAGELSPLFAIYGGNGGNLTKQIQLGTSKAKKMVVDGYTFELKNATETSATITVTKELRTSGNCYIGGCSSQICSDVKDMVSTCEYKEAYACYKTATCGRQQDGKCGWTQTKELQACLSSK